MQRKARQTYETKHCQLEVSPAVGQLYIYIFLYSVQVKKHHILVYTHLNSQTKTQASYIQMTSEAASCDDFDSPYLIKQEDFFL